jgi:hypothetical protein
MPQHYKKFTILCKPFFHLPTKEGGEHLLLIGLIVTHKLPTGQLEGHLQVNHVYLEVHSSKTRRHDNAAKRGLRINKIQSSALCKPIKNRKNAPAPGANVIWRGLEYLQVFIDAWELLHPMTTAETEVLIAPFCARRKRGRSLRFSVSAFSACEKFDTFP